MHEELYNRFQLARRIKSLEKRSPYDAQSALTLMLLGDKFGMFYNGVTHYDVDSAWFSAGQLLWGPNGPSLHDPQLVFRQAQRSLLHTQNDKLAFPKEFIR